MMPALALTVGICETKTNFGPLTCSCGGSEIVWIKRLGYYCMSPHYNCFLHDILRRKSLATDLFAAFVMGVFVLLLRVQPLPGFLGQTDEILSAL